MIQCLIIVLEASKCLPLLTQSIPIEPNMHDSNRRRQENWIHCLTPFIRWNGHHIADDDDDDEKVPIEVMRHFSAMYGLVMLSVTESQKPVLQSQMTL